MEQEQHLLNLLSNSDASTYNADRIGQCQSRGVETPPVAVGVDRDDTSSTMVGEALAYVQGSGLKASAAVYGRLSNSPAARGKPPVADLETGEWQLGRIQLLARFLRHIPILVGLVEIRVARRAARVPARVGGAIHVVSTRNQARGRNRDRAARLYGLLESE